MLLNISRNEEAPGDETPRAPILCAVAPCQGFSTEGLSNADITSDAPGP